MQINIQMTNDKSPTHGEVNLLCSCHAIAALPQRFTSDVWISGNCLPLLSGSSCRRSPGVHTSVGELVVDYKQRLKDADLPRAPSLHQSRLACRGWQGRGSWPLWAFPGQRRQRRQWRPHPQCCPPLRLKAPCWHSDQWPWWKPAEGGQMPVQELSLHTEKVELAYKVEGTSHAENYTIKDLSFKKCYV